MILGGRRRGMGAGGDIPDAMELAAPSAGNDSVRKGSLRVANAGTPPRESDPHGALHMFPLCIDFITSALWFRCVPASLYVLSDPHGLNFLTRRCEVLLPSPS
eukprot:1579812-Amphidinium_carterae.1